MNLDQLKGYWNTLQNLWNQVFQSFDLERALLALGILLLFFILRGVLTRFILRRLHQITKRTVSRLDDELLAALRGPVSWVPLALGLFFALEYLQLQGAMQSFADKAMRSIGTIILFWVLVNSVQPFSTAFDGLRRLYSESLLEWLLRALRWTLAFLGGTAVLDIWGIKVGPILAGLGLLSVGVALGAQDLFKNLISGILILVENWFQKGDWIKVDGVIEGTVERIGFRTTLIRRFDMAPEHVPNSKLADNALTNFSRMRWRRISWTIGLTYGTSIEQLRAIRDELERYILESEEFAPPQEASTFVRIASFSDSSIDLMLYCFTRTTVWGEWLEIKERLACKVKEVVEEAGAAFAFPSRSIYMADAGREAPGEETDEAFIPPGAD